MSLSVSVLPMPRTTLPQSSRWRSQCGQLAATEGRKAAVTDYLVHLFRVWETVNARYEIDLPPDVRHVMEAYADGVNYFSGEGWHVAGGFFAGSPFMLHGHNEHLGWANTVNEPPSGFVFNSNNTPFHSTAPADDLKPHGFSPTR